MVTPSNVGETVVLSLRPKYTVVCKRAAILGLKRVVVFKSPTRQSLWLSSSQTVFLIMVRHHLLQYKSLDVLRINLLVFIISYAAKNYAFKRKTRRRKSKKVTCRGGHLSKGTTTLVFPLIPPFPLLLTCVTCVSSTFKYQQLIVAEKSMLADLPTVVKTSFTFQLMSQFPLCPLALKGILRLPFKHLIQVISMEKGRVSRKQAGPRGMQFETTHLKYLSIKTVKKHTFHVATIIFSVYNLHILIQVYKKL